MRVLLLSTYELGHQPLHVAAPAAALMRAGHDVRATDLSVDALDDALVSWADAVACSVPMHTAFRLARDVCDEIRRRRSSVPLCLYGLYAGLDGAQGGPAVADATIAGEYEPALVAWVDAVARGDTAALHTRRVVLGRGRFDAPARHLLPPLERYAHAVIGGEERRVGYVEASHGCAHRCRHCPVPVVYDGRTRLVGVDTVVEDVTQMVAMGARHITFGDPDFLNGPHHARRVVDAVHGAFPGLSFDITAKVEHVLRQRPLWPVFAQAGCVFVVSAFESASDTVLARLDKGHTVADEADAVEVLRSAGIEPRPSLLPFTPWTEAADVLDLLDLVARLDLVGNVDPVHYAIRLLVPPDSLLVRAGQLEGVLDGYDDEHLGWSWHAPDARLDDLQGRIAALAEQAGREQWRAVGTYDAVRAMAVEALDARDRRAAPATTPALASPLAPDERPRLTEGWFCCAEPTRAQHETMFAASIREGN